ncbi:hypothetical protein V6N12_023659 [Hibiscus sabdariffa]|uniref:Uncharacterized protein n=1 Tax=Hibiscus sabdariffa TaxID=183260 RepID=A0ABR2FYR8_9ROSI
MAPQFSEDFERTFNMQMPENIVSSVDLGFTGQVIASIDEHDSTRVLVVDGVQFPTLERPGSPLSLDELQALFRYIASVIDRVVQIDYSTYTESCGEGHSKDGCHAGASVDVSDNAQAVPTEDTIYGHGWLSGHEKSCHIKMIIPMKFNRWVTGNIDLHYKARLDVARSSDIVVVDVSRKVSSGVVLEEKENTPPAKLVLTDWLPTDFGHVGVTTSGTATIVRSPITYHVVQVEATEDSDVESNIKDFADKGREWNVTIFWHIGKKKKELLPRLWGIDRSLHISHLDFLIQLDLDLRAEFVEVLGHEESLWLQKSRVQWANFGDRNTSYFHRCTMQRRRANFITTLRDSNMVWCSDQVRCTMLRT